MLNARPDSLGGAGRHATLRNTCCRTIVDTRTNGEESIRDPYRLRLQKLKARREGVDVLLSRVLSGKKDQSPMLPSQERNSSDTRKATARACGARTNLNGCMVEWNTRFY